MAYIDITITHNGTNITSSVISYNKEQYICTGVGTISITVVDDGRFYDEWDTVVLYEEGTKKGTYYIKAKRRDKGAIIIEAQDASTKLVDYFVDESTQFSYVTYTRFWIEKYLNEAGVDYTFQTSEQGAPINKDYPVGLSTAFEIITGFLQMSNWYMYFNANNKCIIGSLSLHSGTPKVRLQDDEIISIHYTKNDKMLRNRAVVWGGTDPWSGTWVFADISVNTRWNYDSGDKRAVVLANSTIYSVYDAQRLAKIMLNEFSRITEIKTVEVAGNLNVELGDYAFIDSKFQRGGGMITTIESNMTKGGFITTLTLDQRCPRLFGFIGYITDFVYIGTDGAGVWRKELDGSTWMDYSQGITDLGITDLSINNGVFGTTTNTGLLFYKYIYGYWTQFNADSAYFPSGAMPSGATIVASGTVQSGVYATCVTVDKIDNSIYGGFTTNSGVLGSGWLVSGMSYSGSWGSGESWVIKLDSNGNFLRSDKVQFYVGSELLDQVTIVDIDNNEVENILSVIAGGQLIYVKAPDDGNFGKIGIIGDITDKEWGGTDELVRDTVGMHYKRDYNFATTDRSQMISSLPPADVDFSELEVTSSIFMGKQIGQGYNEDEDLGSWWTADDGFYGGTISLYKEEWGDQSWEYGRDIYQTTEMFDVVEIPDDLHGKMVASYYKETEQKFVFLFERQINYTSSGVLNWRMYEYDINSQEFTEKATYDKPYVFPEFSIIPPPSHASTGNVYVAEGYINTDSGVLPYTRYITICNLETETISYSEENFSGYDEVVIYPTSIQTSGDTIMLGKWRVENTIGENNWAWGKIYYEADCINKFTGAKTSSSLLVYEEENIVCEDDTICSSWMPFDNTAPFYLGNIYYHLRESWNFQSNGGISVYCPFSIEKLIINRQYPYPPYDPTCCYDLPTEFIYILLGVSVSTGGSISLIYDHKQVQEENGGDPQPTDFPEWAYRENNNSFTGIYSCGGSRSQGGWWLVIPKPGHTETEEKDYYIYNVATGVPVYQGIINYPDDFPYSTYHINNIAPQTDDVDGTLYISWKHNTSSSYYLIGHAPTGGITKRMSDAGGIGSAHAIYIMGNSVVYPMHPTTTFDSPSVARFWDYDQPTGNTMGDYIVRQKDADMEAIYVSMYRLNVDTSKSSPTVIYYPTISGGQTSFLGVSVDNTSGSFTVRNTTFPISDVRVFDVTDPAMFVVESGTVDSGFFRYIGIVNSGGFFAIDAILTAASGISIVTASGTSASGTSISGAIYSGLTHLETTNIAMSGTPYFFVASPSGFWQRNPGSPYWIDYSYSLPGNTITIIRADDRI